MFFVHGPCLISGGQVQFFSTWHAPLQPSPGKLFPSSHASMPPWLFLPSPHASGYWATQPAVLVPLHWGSVPAVPPVEPTEPSSLMDRPPPPFVPAPPPPAPPLPAPLAPPAPPAFSIEALVQAIPASASVAARPSAAR